MTSTLRLINRFVPILILIVLISLGFWRFFTFLASSSEAAPLRFTQTTMPAIPIRTAHQPERDLFAADGTAWALSNETTGDSAKNLPDVNKVTGVIRLPGGPVGVMVGAHFVAIGEALGDGHLKDVRFGQYVVEVDGVDQVQQLDAEHTARIESLVKKRRTE